MAPSFDYAVSSLLCAEDEGLFSDADYEAVEDDFGATWEPRDHRTRIQDQNFSSLLPVQSDDCLDLIFQKECQHLPADGYLSRLRSGILDLTARTEAANWIGKVHAHYNFGPLCAYLSTNYLDRFLSTYELPNGKAWMTQLLAVACLSLAAKMEETEVPLSLDLQVGEAKFVFEAKTIQRMELLVLSTLKWRMQAVTPFSFLDYFLFKLDKEKKLPRSAITLAIQLILGTTKGIDFLGFKPSEVAAAVAISVALEAQMVMDTEEAASVLSQYVQKESLLKCVQMINDSSLISSALKGSASSVLSVPQSPNGVLDAACLSYISDGSSCASSPSDSPGNKRRKLARNMGEEL